MEISTENSTVFRPVFTNTRPESNESIVPPVILFVVSTIENVAALVILIRSSTEHKWKPFYRFVGGLIASDLSGMVLSYPFVLSAHVSKLTMVFSKTLCGYMSFIITFAFLTHALTICAMSLDRFLAFIFPLAYRNLSNSYRVNLTLLGIWISSAILCSLHVIGLGSFRSFYPGSWCFVDFNSDDAEDIAVTYLYAIIGLLIIVTTIILNAIVILSMCRKSCHGDRRSAKDKRNDGSIIAYLIAFVILFTLCTTPMLVIRILIKVGTGNHKDKEFDMWIVRLTSIKLFIDPLIYLLLKRNTFTSVRRLARSLGQRFRVRRVEGECSQVTNRQELGDRTEDTNV